MIAALFLLLLAERDYEGITQVVAPTPETTEPEPKPDSIIEPPLPSEQPPPTLARTSRHRFVFRNLSVVRVNPIGVVDEFTGGYRYTLHRRPGRLFDDTFVASKLYVFANPAYVRLGPLFEVQPWTILNLHASYTYVGYFGSFNQLQSFRTPTANHSDKALRRLAKEGTNFRSSGHMLTFGMQLQIALGNVALRNVLRGYYTDYRVRKGDTVFYEQAFDTLVSDRGWVLQNEFDALLLVGSHIKTGLRHTLTQAFYRTRDFLPDEPISQPNGPTHRIGPSFLYTFYDNPTKRINKPTLVLLAQWWVQHRYRADQAAGAMAALPYIIVGFLFEGDFRKPKKNRPKPARGSS